MTDDQGLQRSQAEAELEREIRDGRKFTLEEAIGRMAGPGAMKGESPVARLRQAEIEIGLWLENHLAGADGALRVVLHRYVRASEFMLHNFDKPLLALAGCCQRVIDSDYLLRELVREADVEWSRVMGERPHFEKTGVAPDPEDAYTIASVRNVLSQVLQDLSTQTPSI